MEISMSAMTRAHHCISPLFVIHCNATSFTYLHLFDSRREDLQFCIFIQYAFVVGKPITISPQLFMKVSDILHKITVDELYYSDKLLFEQLLYFAKALDLFTLHDVSCLLMRPDSFLSWTKLHNNQKVQAGEVVLWREAHYAHLIVIVAT